MNLYSPLRNSEVSAFESILISIALGGSIKEGSTVFQSGIHSYISSDHKYNVTLLYLLLKDVTTCSKLMWSKFNIFVLHFLKTLTSKHTDQLVNHFSGTQLKLRLLRSLCVTKADT